MDYQRHLFGVAVVAIIGTTWCAATQFSSRVVEDPSHPSPLFSAVLGTALHVLYLPCYFLLLDFSHVIRKVELRQEESLGETKRAVREPSTLAEVQSFIQELQQFAACQCSRVSRRDNTSHTSGGTWCRYAALFWFLWTVANAAYISALAFINAGIVTALFNTAPAWVALMSYCILGDGERPKYVAVAAVAALLAVGGAALVVVGTSTGGKALHLAGSDGLIGCSLSIVAAVAAAGYKVSYRRVYGKSTVRLAFLLLSTIGFLMVLVGWAVVLAVLGSGWQHVDWNMFPWGLQMLSSLAAMAFNLSIAVGVAKTYPLYVAVGTILGLPLNVAVDAWRGAHVGAIEGVGMGIVALSFVSLAVADAWCQADGAIEEDRRLLAGEQYQALDMEERDQGEVLAGADPRATAPDDARQALGVAGGARAGVVCEASGPGVGRLPSRDEEVEKSQNMGDPGVLTD